MICVIHKKSVASGERITLFYDSASYDRLLFKTSDCNTHQVTENAKNF
jgi:hypothetical protein